MHARRANFKKAGYQHGHVAQASLQKGQLPFFANLHCSQAYESTARAGSTEYLTEKPKSTACRPQIHDCTDDSVVAISSMLLCRKDYGPMTARTTQRREKTDEENRSEAQKEMSLAVYATGQGMRLTKIERKREG